MRPRISVPGPPCRDAVQFNSRPVGALICAMHKEQSNDAGLSAQWALWNELALLFLLRSTTSCRITSAGRATTGQAHDLYAAMPVCLTAPCTAEWILTQISKLVLRSRRNCGIWSSLLCCTIPGATKFSGCSDVHPHQYRTGATAPPTGDVG